MQDNTLNQTNLSQEDYDKQMLNKIADLSLAATIRNEAPKPKPPVKQVEVPVEKKSDKPVPPKRAFELQPHLTHKPFRNNGLEDLKTKLKRR